MKETHFDGNFKIILANIIKKLKEIFFILPALKLQTSKERINKCRKRK